MLASMSALPPSPLFSAFAWPLDDHIINKDSNTPDNISDSVVEFSNTSTQSAPHPKPFPAGDGKAAKKLSHNANERHRRQRVNHMYSFLRSLLPRTHRTTKKMSIPATVTHILNYIPELQQLVRTLIQNKEELLLTARMQGDGPRREALGLADSINVWAGDEGIMIQISTYESRLSGILLILEQLGLLLLHASSSQSSCGMLLYSLHCKGGESSRLMDCELLRNKLKSLYQNRDR